jgi:cystathionine beta-lyase
VLPNPLTAFSLDQLRTRTSTKWTWFEPDVLPLWVAEMDVEVAAPVREALVDLVGRSDTGYPDTGPVYAESLARFAADRWGWTGLDPARSAVVADVMTGVAEAVRLVTDPGARVVVNPPVYPPFYPFVERAGREVVEVPLGADDRLDLAALEDAFARAGRGSAYLLCSPHNPVGTVHTAEELAGVAALAREHGVRVVVDEIHAPLVLEGAVFTPYLSVPGSEDAVALHSASKAWNLAGFKAAVLLGGPETADDLARLPEVVSHGPSHAGVTAHRAALDHGRDWLDALLAGLAENRDLLDALLARELPDVGWRRGEATYLRWLDFSSTALGEDPAADLVERGRVALTGGLPFGTGGAHHARLNFATSPEVLTEAVARIARSL